MSQEAYFQRDLLASVLSLHYPAFLAVDSDKTVLHRTIVYVELPTGQVSWHIPNSQVHLFRHLDWKKKGRHWDGHTTKEKHQRIKRLIRKLAKQNHEKTRKNR